MPTVSGSRTQPLLLAALFTLLLAIGARSQPVVLVKNGHPTVDAQSDGWRLQPGFLEAPSGTVLPILTQAIDRGDFHLRARLRMLNQEASAASFFLDNNHFGFEGASRTIYLNGPIFGTGVKLLQPSTNVFQRGAWIGFEAIRTGSNLKFLLNGQIIHTTDDNNRSYTRIGFSPTRSTLHLSDCSISGTLIDPPKPLPYTDVFLPGRDGYSHIRIPALVATRTGTLLAFAEGRDGGDHSNNDIILKRSIDNGKSWTPMQTVHSAGELSLNNPQPVVLPDTGRILLIYQRNKHGERGVQPGFEGDDVGYTLIQHSDDDGKSWSTPRDITRGVKRPAPVTSHASGPGIGIVLRRGKHKGRIIMPFNQGPFGHWKVYAAWSDDGGETWGYGDTAPEDGKGQGNEVQMVELTDGRILLNCRAQGGTRHRKIAYSSDAGQTWSPLRDDPFLPEPQCQASLIRYADPLDNRPGVLLFANPGSQSGRHNGTLRASYDDGATWPVARTVYPGGFAYSCLTVLRDRSIGLLFERDDYSAISFTRTSLDWLEALHEKDPDEQ